MSNPSHAPVPEIAADDAAIADAHAPVAGTAPRTPGKRSRGGPKRPLIGDVAAAAGVSPITVSRVFNAPQSVAPETLARVREVVTALGYVPNRLAGGLSSAKSRLIAVIVPTIAHSLFSATIQIFSETMAASGYQVLLALSGYGSGEPGSSAEATLLDAVLSRRPEAVMLIGVARGASLRQRLAALGIPIVETWDMTEHPIDMLVGFSHYRIGEAVAAHLLSRGTRRPGLVSANDDRALERRAGFRAGLARVGIHDVAEVIVAPPSSVSVGKAALAALLAQCAELDSVFCGSDLLALGVLGESRRLGHPVPETLAICGFGDLEFAAETAPALTTVRVDGPRVGVAAARCLLDRLNGDASEHRIDVGFDIVARATT